MVNLVRHDLEFILKQIKIAEAHSAGTPLTEIRIDAQGNVTTDPNAPLAISAPLSPYGLRTVDGSYNNLVAGREEWGASDTPFLQITDPYWRNEGDDQIVFGTPQNPVPLNNNNYGTPGSVVDADPRLVSNLIVDQTLDNPAAIDPPPLNWSTLKYVLRLPGGPKCPRSVTSRKRSSPSYARSM